MTKKELSWKEMYLNSTFYSIYNCYERPSSRKVDVFNAYKQLEYENEIRGVRILSYNCQAFTLGYQKRTVLNGVTVWNLCVATSWYTYGTNIFFNEEGELI